MTEPTPADQELLGRFWDHLTRPEEPGVPDDDEMAAALAAYEDQPLPELPDRRVLTDPPPLSLAQETYLREVMRLNGLTAADFNDAGLSPVALLNNRGHLDAHKTAAAVYHLRSLKWG